MLPIRFVAAEAGFFPPTPLTLLADIGDYEKVETALERQEYSTRSRSHNEHGEPENWEH